LMQIPKERRPQLGLVPLGSGNDFSHAVGMPKEPLHALRQVFTGQPKTIDIVRLEDNLGRVEYWGNTLGIGFDTTVTIRSRRFRQFRGFLIYLVAVIQTILLNHDAPRMQVQTDREQWDQEMVMLVLCNGGREGGGFRVSPQAVPNDGLLNYAGIQRVSRLMMFRLLPEVMRGTHARFRQVRMGEFTHMQVQSDRALYIHMDGEIFAGWGNDVRTLRVDLLPDEVQVVT